jgi:hypothetical protein
MTTLSKCSKCNKIIAQERYIKTKLVCKACFLDIKDEERLRRVGGIRRNSWIARLYNKHNKLNINTNYI